jgi:hypothetical protein
MSRSALNFAFPPEAINTVLIRKNNTGSKFFISCRYWFPKNRKTESCCNDIMLQNTAIAINTEDQRNQKDILGQHSGLSVDKNRKENVSFAETTILYAIRL